MKLNKLYKLNKFNKIAGSLALLSFVALPMNPSAYAKTKILAEKCKLGETCTIPGDDGGQTVYEFTPETGTHYVCEINSNKESLKFIVSGGLNFNLIKGGGLYNANPNATVELEGRFDKPEEPTNKGQIKITQLPLSSTGTVKCYAQSG